MNSMDLFVRISSRDRRYFELEDGTPFIPVGLNLCFVRFLEEDADILACYRKRLAKFAENGGNFARIWLGVPFLNLEPDKPGVFSMEKLNNLHEIVKIAKLYGIRLKLTLEHFRRLDAKPQAEQFPGAANFENRVYRHDNGGFADTMKEYFQSPAARLNFIKKLELLSKHFANEPTIMAWELWNEINSTGPVSHWKPWTEVMLTELHRLFPKQFALQSLGCLGGFGQYAHYDALASLKENDFLQIHQYIDPSCEIDCCRGPMDLLCRNSIEELHCRRRDIPAILAETGAVEWAHCRASHLYESDKEGTLLHDALFAPFFAGSAGCGQFWHWDHFYIERHDLWEHFSCFAKVIRAIAPAEEAYTAELRENLRFRFHILRGRTHDLIWMRDKAATYESELERGVPAETFSGMQLSLTGLLQEKVSQVTFYAPWEKNSGVIPQIEDKLLLPSFRRSLVLKLEHETRKIEKTNLI